MAARENALPPCTHRPPCPGCPRYGDDALAPATRAALEALARELGAELEPERSVPALGHRHRARLMVRGRLGTPKIGLFQAGSHRIVDIPRCHVHHPLVNEVAASLKRAMRAQAIEPYADRPHRGVVRALQVVVERSSGRAQVVVVTNSADASAAEPMLDALAGELGDALQGLWWNGNPERTNTILGPHWKHLRGAETVCETIGGARVFFPPGAFGQSNLGLADRVVDRVHAATWPGARIAELYAGCGAIGLGLVQRGHEVLFNEIHPAGLRGLELGIAALPESARARASCAGGPASGCAAEAGKADVAIVDPPRRGLDETLCSALSGAPPGRLVYVSCDLSRFERDAHVLVGGGRLRLRSLAPFALFPFTDHVETVAVFERTG